MLLVIVVAFLTGLPAEAEQQNSQVVNVSSMARDEDDAYLHYSYSTDTSNNSDCTSKHDSSAHHHYCSSTSVDSCPAWFICNATENGSCLCGPQEKGIVCNQKILVSGVLNCYCVTRVENKTYLGSCFYNCERQSVYKNMYQNVYHEISDVADLNDYMCGRFNRTGISCGQCKPGQHPLVLSYNLSCVDCPDANKNWWKFAFYGFVNSSHFLLFPCYLF